MFFSSQKLRISILYCSLLIPHWKIGMHTEGHIAVGISPDHAGIPYADDAILQVEVACAEFQKMGGA
jgi:hypothetical protein